MQVSNVQVPPSVLLAGNTESEPVPVSAWSDAISLTIMPHFVAQQVQVSPDYDPLTPLTATWINVNKSQWGNPSVWDNGIGYTIRVAGKAIRFTCSASAGVNRNVDIWKTCLVGA